MVAAVLGLKYRVVRHQLQREWWRALLLIGGGIWSLSLLPAAAWIQVQLSFDAPDTRGSVLVGFAAICLLGWVTVPLLVTGLEDTLDPGRFASLGVSARLLMPGLTIAAFLTLPSLFFAVVFVILAGAWRYDGTPVVAVAIVGSLLTVALMVMLARVAVAWTARAIATRRARLWSLVVVVSGAALVAPAGWLIFRDGFDNALAFEIPVVLEWLSRTPVGAGMAAPSSLALGDEWGAAWRLLLMVAAVLAAWGAWRANVAFTLVHPVYRGGGARRRVDSILGATTITDRADATVAVRLRAQLYWFTDARYLVAALSVVTLPVVFFIAVVPLLGLDPRWGFAAPVLLAASIGWGRHNDIAYDSTALWMDVVAGRLGRAIVIGRMQAVLMWAVPSVLLASFGVLLWSGRWDVAPGLIGACAGALGMTLGISAVTSVLLPYRAPGPGENPFGAEVGSVGASIVAQLVSGFAMLGMLPFVTVPLVLALTVDTRWAWLALATGSALGVVGAIAGARVGGSLYDRRSGRLLAAVS